MFRQGVAAWVLGLGLQAQTPAAPPPPRPLVVGLDADYYPFEFADAKGRASGFTVDLIQAIARDEGLNLEFHPGGWSDLREGLREGRIDVLAGMLRSPVREASHAFSAPHLQMDYALFTRKETAFLGSLEQLRGRKVLVQEATFIHEHLLEGGQGSLIRPLPTEREALIRLAMGEGDAAVVTQLGGNALLREHGFTNLQSKVLPLQDLDYCFAVLKDRSDLADMGLIDRLDRGMARLHASGEFDQIYRKWLGTPRQGRLPHVLRAVAWVAVPLLALLGLVLLWNTTLRRQVAARTRELRIQQEHLEELVQARTADLQRALEDVKMLSGLLPICASCKKVRDDQGFWTQVEQYIEGHSEAHFTHGLCPECIELFFPSLASDRKARKESAP